MAKKIPASYRLLNIVLVESYFKRDINVNPEDTTLENDFDIETKDRIEDNHIAIWVTVSFSIGEKNEKAVESKITMLGLFECVGEVELSIKEFTTSNGPAIIFPFVREHLATVSVKSGITAILLPPINFKKRLEEKKREKVK